MNLLNRIGTTGLLLLCSVGEAAPFVSASVDRTTIAADETVTLSITVAGTEKAVAPELSHLRDFDVVSTGESRALNIGTGGTSIETVFQYVLRPTSPGTKTIPSIEVQAGGKTLRTQPLTVHVSAAQGPKSSVPLLPMPGGPPTKGEGDDVFIRCTVDKERAYVGEQVLLTFSLSYATQLGSVEYEPAGTEGFRTYPVPAPPPRYEVVNGRQYAVRQELKLLFPTAPGLHTITPATVEYSTGLWSPFPRRLTTKPITVNVVRLPDAGKPPSFSGVVGQLEVNLHVDRETIRAGEAATLTTAVTGWGNLEAMEAPKLELPAGLRRYRSSEHRESVARPYGSGYRLTGEALFDNVIVPAAVGDFTIPAVEISYFDPTTERYKIARSHPVVIHVEPGDRVLSVKEPGDKTTLKPLPDHLVGRNLGVVATGPVLISQALAVVWLIGSIMAFRQRRLLERDPRLARARTAARRAKRLIRGAKDLSPAEAATQIAQALASFVADKLDLPRATVSAASVHELAEEHGLSSEAATRLADVLSACDAARFGPAHEANPHTLAAEASAVVRELERAVGRMGRRIVGR